MHMVRWNFILIFLKGSMLRFGLICLTAKTMLDKFCFSGYHTKVFVNPICEGNSMMYEIFYNFRKGCHEC